MPVSGPKFKHLQLVDFQRVQIIHQDRPGWGTTIVPLGFRNLQLTANGPGRRILNFAVSGNRGGFAIVGIPPNRMFCPFTIRLAAVRP
jgi:hypothetical protein